MTGRILACQRHVSESSSATGGIFHPRPMLAGIGGQIDLDLLADFSLGPLISTQNMVNSNKVL
jgi:hypothetical protein